MRGLSSSFKLYCSLPFPFLLKNPPRFDLIKTKKPLYTSSNRYILFAERLRGSVRQVKTSFLFPLSVSRYFSSCSHKPNSIYSSKRAMHHRFSTTHFCILL
ncbi:hypothetical protein ACOSP7_025702 [Xanthoceras sorbifolium]